MVFFGEKNIFVNGRLGLLGGPRNLNYFHRHCIQLMVWLVGLGPGGLDSDLNPLHERDWDS